MRATRTPREVARSKNIAKLKRCDFQNMQLPGLLVNAILEAGGAVEIGLEKFTLRRFLFSDQLAKIRGANQRRYTPICNELPR